ncbi:uncharacterized protein LOC141695705 [Apium graveolens]|uniref:uncharacterized protein LOC141695705 n=1 Tax=Apium graveolens TaxID=4045 RepID=UPI003D792DF9
MPGRIVAATKDYLSQWKKTQNRFYTVPIEPSVHGDGTICWAKSQKQTVKITVDAALFDDKNGTDVGLIERDHSGALLLAKSRLFREIMRPSLAKAVAGKEVLSWLKEMRWETAIIESDCLVVQSIHTTICMQSRLGLLIEECKRLMKSLNNM